jgi:hypothetical protein
VIAPVRAFQLLADQESRAFARAKLCAVILVTRRFGKLETANKVSEWLHNWDAGAPPQVCHGFPDDSPADSGPRSK